MTISDISFQNLSREINGVAYQSHSGFFLRGQCAAIVIAAAFRTALALPYRIGTRCTAVLLSRLYLAGTRRMRALFHGGRISCGTLSNSAGGAIYAGFSRFYCTVTAQWS